ncbi:fumarylacetoacetase domain protein, partial [Vibrio parahaemolyticus V-223/04]
LALISGRMAVLMSTMSS